MNRRRFCAAIAAAAAAGSLPARAASTAAAGRRDEAYRAWDRVLARHVDDAGRVDFAGIARDPGDLQRFVDYVATESPGSHPDRFPTRAARLAYYINSYNALAMHGIVDDGIPGSLGGLKKFGFFFFRKFTVGGERISLYAYENDVIRPLGEERIHFALNCMAVSCPRLPRKRFSAGNLDAELDRETRRFFAEPRNATVDRERKRVRLSEILDFYTEDFLANGETLVDYVNRYREEKIPDGYEVAFFDYDWTVNRQGRD